MDIPLLDRESGLGEAAYNDVEDARMKTIIQVEKITNS